VSLFDEGFIRAARRTNDWGFYSLSRAAGSVLSQMVDIPAFGAYVARRRSSSAFDSNGPRRQVAVLARGKARRAIAIRRRITALSTSGNGHAQISGQVGSWSMGSNASGATAGFVFDETSSTAPRLPRCVFESSGSATSRAHDYPPQKNTKKNKTPPPPPPPPKKKKKKYGVSPNQPLGQPPSVKARDPEYGR